MNKYKVTKTKQLLLCNDYTLIETYSWLVYSDVANKPGQLLHTGPLMFSAHLEPAGGGQG